MVGFLTCPYLINFETDQHSPHRDIISQRERSERHALWVDDQVIIDSVA